MEYAAIRVGPILGRVFGLYRRHFAVLLPVAFGIFLAISALDGYVEASGIGSLLVVTILNIAVMVIYKGIVAGVVRDARVEHDSASADPSVGSLGSLLGPLIGAAILYGIGVGVGLLVLIPGCIFVTIWAVVAPVVVIEGRGPIASFRRSRELVRGYGWPIFATIVATIILIGIAFLIAFVIVFVVLFSVPSSGLGVSLINIVAWTVFAPVEGLLASVLYYELLALKGEAGPLLPPER